MPEGRFREGQFNLDVAPWFNVSVRTEAKGYGASAFDFFITPGDTQEKPPSAWKKTKLTTVDGREIEYQITYEGPVPK
jgi:hypothetical protein